MKRYILSLLLTVFAVLPGRSMTYAEAQEHAWFLTDKMAYELNLTTEQYDRVYEINLDYFMSIRTASDCSGRYWDFRDADLRCVLFDWQYTLFATLDYFFHPIRWIRSAWYFPIFDHYRSGYFFFDKPTIFTKYVGKGWRNRSEKAASPYVGKRPSAGAGMRDSYDKKSKTQSSRTNGSGSQKNEPTGGGNQKEGGSSSSGKDGKAQGNGNRNQSDNSEKGGSQTGNENSGSSSSKRLSNTSTPSMQTGSVANSGGSSATFDNVGANKTASGKTSYSSATSSSSKSLSSSSTGSTSSAKSTSSSSKSSTSSSKSSSSKSSTSSKNSGKTTSTGTSSGKSTSSKSSSSKSSGRSFGK